MNRDELASVLRAVRIDADGSFRFPAGAAPIRAESLTAALTHALYAGAFARGVDDERRAQDPASEEELARRLSAANRSRDRWEVGWRIESIEASRSIVATRGRQQRTAKPGEYALTFTAELPPRVGMAAMLFFPRESLTLQEHVYYAFGETIAGSAESTRIYIQAPVDVLPELFERLTGELNRDVIPFTLKTMLAAVDRDRRDATVLYVQRDDCARVEPLFLALPESLRARLGPHAPLFTREIAPGIGMGESPDEHESFGMQRSRLLAEGIVDAWAAGVQDEEGRMLAVQRRFAAAGVDWDRPHLAAPARIVLTAANVVGWLSSREVITDDGWQVDDRSSRNRNFAVARDVGGVFVKQLRVQGPASLRMMEREAAIYRWAAANDAVRELLPAFIRFDRDAQVLITELVPDATSVETITVDVAHAAARTLAVLHREQPLQSSLLDRQPPGITTAHRGGPLLQWLGAGQLQLIDRVRASSTLAPALDRLAAEWSADRQIHGDVKRENCLWSGTSRRMHWIDWELADAGDPLWDAGCFVQACLARGNVDVANAFIDAYASDAREPILRYAAARHVQSALEVMHGHPAPTPLALRFLAAAEKIA